MKSKMLIILVALVLVSCATPGIEPEPTPAPELPALQEAMHTIAGKLPTENHQMVAVLPFAERGIGSTLLGEYVAEKLMIALSATGRVQLVERNRLETIYQEQKLGATGLIDDETAASIGNIAGAQAAIVGILTNIGDCWELTARLLGTSDARILAMAEARFSAQSVPPNLAGQPVKPGEAKASAQRESVRREQPPTAAEQRPVQQPPLVQEAPAPRQPSLSAVFKRCIEIPERTEKKRRCFMKLRDLVFAGPDTQRKIAARRCFRIGDPRRTNRCLNKVFGEAPQ